MKEVSRQVVLSLALILLAVSLVLAAGGGGGGGGSSSSSGGGGSSGSGGSGGSGPFLSNLECDDKGVLTFQQKPQEKPVVAVFLGDGSRMSDVPGTWEGVKFTSEEVIFRRTGEYQILDATNGNKTVECPGLKFSCKQVKLAIKECTTDVHTMVSFSLENASLEDLKYQFATPDAQKKLTYEKDSFSAELRELKVEKKGIQDYVLIVPGYAEVTKVQVSLPRCLGNYYIYSQMDCASPGRKTEESGKMLKCGGLLELTDRVRCRIDLREEKKDEYENFFPEECRSWEDKGACVKLYKTVQPCWKLQEDARIPCLKGKVGLAKGVSEEKRACQELASGERGKCVSALEKNTHALIKLRLYNLEEKAEGFEEEGKITEEQLTDFVVQMEQSKLAYNEAKTKAERKQVIMQARKYWVELVKKMDKVKDMVEEKNMKKVEG